MIEERPELRKRSANFVPLTPISFLSRATILPTNSRRPRRARFTSPSSTRGRRLAHALTKAGVKRGDTVAILAPPPALLEAHYAVPMIGAVLNPINIRLDPATIAFCMEHGEAKVLLADCEFAHSVQPALEKLKTNR